MTLSHMSVHQVFLFKDGSCNGLQHYAALGRDKVTNPRMFTEESLLGRVLEIMEIDAKKDPTTNLNALHAKFLIDQVVRKLVKQTVMTSMYDVTYIGARDQKPISLSN
ncbi:unnamed protein product [Linum tenue]|uniref:DNA-directed RNA polymerase n=1 Tax=Linum tenue TaxID=586396 RepID=A0AAV0NYZ3_9ROSI|nr:unnamed protein product [Linum tenue]